jgi:hypothetical protein
VYRIEVNILLTGPYKRVEIRPRWLSFLNFAADHERLYHRGPARVFDREEDAMSAVTRGEIKAGDVIVIRYEGLRGGPGMREMLEVTGAIVGAGLGESVALLKAWCPKCVGQLPQLKRDLWLYCLSGLKKARISCTSASGCSSAAKCPPACMTLQCWIL